MVIAQSRISSKVIAHPPMPMRRAEDGVGIGQAVQAHAYRTWLTKESRKYWERVTQRSWRAYRREGACATCAWADTPKDPHRNQECTMCPSTRYVNKHAKARQPRRLTAQARLARDLRQAQQAVKALEEEEVVRSTTASAM